jgi:DNA-binding CsgD family transcriptional regulator
MRLSSQRRDVQAVDEWKGLIAARWTLLDVTEKDGRRYLVARQNRPRARGDKELTEREQEVVACAAMGHHNKLIAYNLGISHSTVRVLMARAAGKVGAHSSRRGRSIHRAANTAFSSVMNKAPAGPATRPLGELSPAGYGYGPSTTPDCPGEPMTVVTTPVAMTSLRMVWLPESAT